MPPDDLPLKTHRSILEAEIAQAESELERPAHGLLVSGVLAGLGVGTSVLLMASVVSRFTGILPDPFVALLVANAFAVGFVLVILSRVDLFTEYTTIAILPVLTGRAPIEELLRLWGLVLAGNVVGAIAFAALLAALGPSIGAIDAASFGTLADEAVGSPWMVTAGGALLAGWLMGVLSWLIAASRDTISQIAFVWMIAGAIGFGGLPHIVTGTCEIAAAMFSGHALQSSDAAAFVLWTTVGNSAGGILFAVLIRYSLVVRHAGDEQRRSRATDEQRSAGPR